MKPRYRNILMYLVTQGVLCSMILVPEHAFARGISNNPHSSIRGNFRSSGKMSTPNSGISNRSIKNNPLKATKKNSLHTNARVNKNLLHHQELRNNHKNKSNNSGNNYNHINSNNYTDNHNKKTNQGFRRSGKHNKTVSLAHPDKKNSKIKVNHKKQSKHNIHTLKKRHKHDRHDKNFKFYRNNAFILSIGLIPYSIYGYTHHHYPKYHSYIEPERVYYDDNYFYNNLPAGTDNLAWTLLSQGEIHSALEKFTKDIKYYPDAGTPRIGYSIAAAAAGELTKAVLSMREALRIEPGSFRYIYLDEEILNIIDNLIYVFEKKIQHNYRSPDEAFMLSALHFLRQDYLSSHSAMGRAIIDGDASHALENLQDLIFEKLREQYAGK